MSRRQFLRVRHLQPSWTSPRCGATWINVGSSAGVHHRLWWSKQTATDWSVFVKTCTLKSWPQWSPHECRVGGSTDLSATSTCSVRNQKYLWGHSGPRMSVAISRERLGACDYYKLTVLKVRTHENTCLPTFLHNWACLAVASSHLPVPVVEFTAT